MNTNDFDWISPEEEERIESIKKISNNFESLRAEYINDLKDNLESKTKEPLNSEITFNCGRIFVLDMIQNEWIYCSMEDMIKSEDMLKDKDELDSLVERLYDSENSALGIIEEFRELINEGE